MQNILILGAGKSSVALIDYLVQHAYQHDWTITVADITTEQALIKTKGRDNTHAIGADLTNYSVRQELIQGADIVISMLPAALHLSVAQDCVQFKKNLVTPSYISEAMKQLEAEVKANGLIFMNEMGLDPGIDHMSALQLIDDLKGKGCKITGFESHCGGLIAPESDNNPWHYKFTWNPRNVILAGQGDGGIHYLKDGNQVDLEYRNLFENPRRMHVAGFGNFESYPNRDSLKYIADYSLQGVKTMYRGTLRIPPFCKGWNFFVKTGFTQESEMSFIELTQNIQRDLDWSDEETKALVQSVELDKELANYSQATLIPAKQLQSLLEEKWKMQPDDKDMIVMVHQITFEEEGKEKKIQSSLVYVGKDAEHTAMATTVGLPVAMVTKMILTGKLERKGVLMPKYPEIYNPILAELKQYGISFNEEVIA